MHFFSEFIDLFDNCQFNVVSLGPDDLEYGPKGKGKTQLCLLKRKSTHSVSIICIGSLEAGPEL